MAIFIKFMYVPFREILDQWQYILVFMSIASMILGAVGAMAQKNIKRLMAYSSIGHMGYALAGIASGTENGFKSTFSIYFNLFSYEYWCFWMHIINEKGWKILLRK